MLLRIAHVSDLHIRNFKYRDEYREAFQNLYRALEKLRPDVIINTGDTVHSKLAVSPELFDDVAEHIVQVSEIAPYWIILGNHDLNLKNKGRTDAISPVVRALRGRTKHAASLLGPGRAAEWRDPPHRREVGRLFNFWHYDIRGHAEIIPDSSDDVVNIGLYHGSIAGCVTDIGFTMEDGERTVGDFSRMDYVLMGDIHKRQSFRNGTMQYPGSLIQQNYGEELRKGFLIWDIWDRGNFSTSFVDIEAPGRFYTIQVPSSLDLAGIDVPDGSRVRALLQGDLSPSRRIELERRIRTAFRPVDVLIPDSTGESLQMEAPDIDLVVGDRDRVMRDHLRELGATEPQVLEACRLFHEIEDSLEDRAGRHGSWQLNRLAWDNMLNYGEGNSIDLTGLRGLVGIFAPNAAGKSSILDILLQSLFDKTSKEVPRNIDLINDNKDVGSMVVEFESGGHPYLIERSIERIHYGQRKFTETKQWGKTSLDFSTEESSLNGTSRPETERAIKGIVGNFEDFVLTSMVSQKPIFGLPGGADLINCKETDRRKILFRFLDLDVYERVGSLVKDRLKGLMGRFKGLDQASIESAMAEKIALRDRLIAEMPAVKAEQDRLERELQEIEDELKRVETALLSARDSAKLQKELERLEKDRTSLTNDVDDVAIGLLAVSSRRKKHLESEPLSPEISMGELRDQINRARAAREATLIELTHVSAKQKAGTEGLKVLQEVPCEGKFPTCRFISQASNFLLERAEVERAYADLQNQKTLDNAEIHRLEDIELVHKGHLAWKSELQSMELELSRLETRRVRALSDLAGVSTLICSVLGELKQISERGGSPVEDAETLLRRRDDAELRRNGAAIDADERMMLLGATISKIEELEEKLRSLQGLSDQIRILELLGQLCGKNGLPYRILGLILPVINDEISKILSGIVKFNVFFEDDPESQTVTLYIRYGDFKSRPLSLGSGAENFIAGLAIRGALLSVSSLPKTDLLIIDEGFGKLDPEHFESVQRMFEYLKGAFGTVLVISHVDVMRDIVDHTIEITSKDGYAHVEAS